MSGFPIGYGPRIHSTADTVPGAGEDWYPRGSLPFYRLLSLLDGSLRIQEDGERYLLGPGDVFLQQPGRSYGFGSIARKHWCFVAFDVVWMHLESAPAESKDMPVQPSAEQIWGSPWPSLLPKDVSATALRSMRRIASLHWRGPLGTHEATAHLVLLLARLAARFAGETTDPSLASSLLDEGQEGGESRLRQAESFARARLPHSVTVAEMAASVGLSREHFTRCYRRKRQCSPADFLHGLRLGEAQRLLRSPGTRLGEISRLLGFSSQGNFTNWFRRATNETPSAWRSRGM